MPGENLTRIEAQERAAVVNTHSYLVELDLTTSDETFRSKTTVKFSATEGASTFIDAITSKVHSVTLNGETLDPAAVSDGVRVRLANLQGENELVIDTDAFYMHTGEGLHRFVDPVDNEVYLYTQFEVPDSRRMFAVFEQPDLKATFQFVVTAPAHWQVVSNQPSPSPVAAGEGKSTWSFQPTPRISSYITALIAGPYVSRHDSLVSSDGRTIPLGVYCRASLEEYLEADYMFEKTKEGFKFFESVFSYPYPFDKYDQLFVPDFNAGAMENAGAVTFTETYVFRGVVAEALKERRVVTILHELAHMWFGDLVTMRWWNDLWLNESFAEYTSHLAVAEATEWVDSWTTFAFSEKAWAYTQDQLPSTHPIVAEIRDLEDVQVNFDGITYAKGASVLKQLGATVGREAFEKGVSAYFKKHAFKNAVLGDLLDELEVTSGRNLTEWSAKWLETAGVNTLRAHVEGSEGVITGFSIEQTAHVDYPTIRPHRMAIGFYNLTDGELIRTHRLELDVDGTSTKVDELVGLERPDLVLLNDDDLTYAKVRLDAQSWKFALENLAKLSDPLARAQVWGSAWDATRDGESSATDFINLVLNNVATENQGTMLITLLRQLLTTTKIYTAESKRHDAIVDVCARLLDLASKAEPGSDNQLLFTRFATYFAEIPAHGDVLEGLLNGSVVFDGLKLDQDMRWDLINGLVMEGRYALNEIEAEFAKDNTANGAKQAIMARTSIRTAEGKKAGWDEVVFDTSLSNTDINFGCQGLIRNHDTKLLVPMVDWYFDAALQVWNTRTFKIAEYILRGAYPFYLANESLASRTREFANRAEVKAIPALHRIILENLDSVERALKAQKMDN
ncbi:MAG: aminopeptidase N [Microbacteriaceae bacterium]